MSFEFRLWVCKLIRDHGFYFYRNFELCRVCKFSLLVIKFHLNTLALKVFQGFWVKGNVSLYITVFSKFLVQLQWESEKNLTQEQKSNKDIYMDIKVMQNLTVVHFKK